MRYSVHNLYPLDAMAMKPVTWKIQIGPHNSVGIAPYYYNGELCGRSWAPVYDGARWIIKHRETTQGDLIETFRIAPNGEKLAGMIGDLYACAKLTISQTDRRGLQIVKYIPMATGVAGRPDFAVSKATSADSGAIEDDSTPSDTRYGE